MTSLSMRTNERNCDNEFRIIATWALLSVLSNVPTTHSRNIRENCFVIAGAMGENVENESIFRSSHETVLI